MVDLARSAATAKRLIEKHARAVTLFKINRTPEDPAMPWLGPDMAANPASSGAGATVNTLACFVPATSGGLGKRSSDREGTLLRDAEQVALIAASSLPTGTDLGQFDAIRDGLDVWKILTVNQLRPAGQSILFEVGVSR